jgi:hypothetical protein
MDIDNIIGCALSTDGRVLAVHTDHVGIWDAAALAERGGPTEAARRLR